MCRSALQCDGARPVRLLCDLQWVATVLFSLTFTTWRDILGAGLGRDVPPTLMSDRTEAHRTELQCLPFQAQAKVGSEVDVRILCPPCPTDMISLGTQV
jgi:hypothetical protein